MHQERSASQLMKDMLFTRIRHLVGVQYYAPEHLSYEKLVEIIKLLEGEKE